MVTEIGRSVYAFEWTADGGGRGKRAPKCLRSFILAILKNNHVVHPGNRQLLKSGSVTRMMALINHGVDNQVTIRRSSQYWSVNDIDQQSCVSQLGLISKVRLHLTFIFYLVFRHTILERRTELATFVHTLKAAI